MKKDTRRWEVRHEKPITDIKNLVEVLLKNREMKSAAQKKEFLKPTDPMKIDIEDLGIKKESVIKAVSRIKLAKENSEHVIIYGDYDADGITATAVIWETLHSIGLDAFPFIPDRFEDGYGIKAGTVEKLKAKDGKLTLIITVDNGIVAHDGIKKAKDLGIDVVVIDHHQKGKLLPSAHCLIHSTSVCGSALAWFFSRELFKIIKPLAKLDSAKMIYEKLQLAAIGTIADQMPVTGINRSVVKYGLRELNNTKRYGLLALFKEAGITEIGPYEVGFTIAPRINSMGRLRHGLESLRLLCTKDRLRALRLANDIAEVNADRQKIVDKVVEHALKKSSGKTPNVIVLADEKYHEGVIGLAAAKLAEKFYRPAIVISKKGDVSKASARSIAGFNIIEAIRKLDKYYIEGGGHPMAAGFSIKTKNIEVFSREINKLAKKLLTDEILQRRLRIDCEIDFSLISFDLLKEILLFEPTGLGNPEPVFRSRNVELLHAKPVGRDAKHLKLKIKQDEHIFDSIYFGGGEIYSKLTPDTKLDLAYSLEKNIWNGYESLQLKVKDIAIKSEVH